MVKKRIKSEHWITSQLKDSDIKYDTQRNLAERLRED